MRPKSTGTISISLETSQSTKVTRIFLPQVQTFSSSWGELGIPALNSTEILLRVPPATKNLMDTKTPAETTREVIKYSTQEWAGRERVTEKTPLEQRDTKSEQTDTFLGIFQEFHKPKPRTQPENPWPRGEKNQGGHGDSRAQESCWRQHF